MKLNYSKKFLTLFLLTICKVIFATDYHIGPNQALSTIAEVPWATLEAGDRVFIHWQSDPYKEKWVINRQGTADNPIEVIGINGPQGQKPVIDGNGAVTPASLDFWNEERGVIKIGGSSVPTDGLPMHIIIDNLEIRSARPAYQFTNDSGQLKNYISNAASIYVEKATDLIIRNCTLHDSGNGIFIGAFNGLTENVLIEKNHIYDNGIVGSFFEHNTYTAGINMIYQFNRFGALRAGAEGNNLKDRSAGLVVRYNWIESGNRQLDLVDAEDSDALVNHPDYSTTLVYGNILIEPEGAGNSQIVHYGGDSGTTSDYRKGNLFFYNNTVVSTRTNNTTLVRLSTNDETAHVFNNIIYSTASGNHLAMIEGSGTFNFYNNWIKEDWKDCHCSPIGAMNDLGNNIIGLEPDWVNFSIQDFSIQTNSLLINNGTSLPNNLLPEHNIIYQYLQHTDFEMRLPEGQLDIGAYEYLNPSSTNNGYFQHKISIIPNPVASIFEIVLEKGSLDKVFIYNELGQLEKSSRDKMIDISTLKSGSYFLKIITKEGQIAFEKIIKE